MKKIGEMNTIELAAFVSDHLRKNSIENGRDRMIKAGDHINHLMIEMCERRQTL